MAARSKKPRNVTIVDVAREANVSYSTVSRVMNNVGYVKSEKRERVLEAIKRLGYVANMQARGLVGGRTRLIGLVVRDIMWSYTEEIVRGIDETLATVNFNLTLFTTHQDRDKEIHFVKMLTQGLVDGLLLLLPLAPESYLAGLKEDGFPYVVIDHRGFDNFSPTVTSTNWQGAYDATDYLVKLGHRRIGMIAGDPALSSAEDRFAGYCAALEAHGLVFDPDFAQTGWFKFQGGIQAANALLNLAHPPTAIFAANDHSALGAIEAIRSRGLSIPDDISIIGFDDVPQAEYLRTSLTTVRQSLDEMGRTATRMLLQQIDNPDAAIEPVVLPTELVIRESTGSPPHR